MTTVPKEDAGLYTYHPEIHDRAKWYCTACRAWLQSPEKHSRTRAHKRERELVKRQLTLDLSGNGTLRLV